MEPEQANSWISLLVVTGLAFLVPLALTRFKRVRVPVVVGEILAGIIVGRSGLGLIEENAWLEVLSTLGFTYLLFLSGLEIDFDILSSSARGGLRRSLRTFGLPVVYFASMLVAGLGAALILQAWDLVSNPFLMALVLSTTSLGVVVPVLKERGLSGSELGQTILLTSILADFGTMLLLTVALALERGESSGQVLLAFGLLVAFLVVDRALHWLQRLPFLSELLQATAEVGVRGSFLLMFVFVVLSQQLGVEFILGAFMAGALVSLAEGRFRGEELRAKLDAIGFGFFIPIFFIMVGARFDLAALTQSTATLLLIPALIGMRYLVKVAPAALYRLQYPWRETWAAGWILSPGLTLMIAASDVGLRAGLIEETMNAAIVLLAILTSTLSPLLFERVLPRHKAEEERLLLIVEANEQTLTVARNVDEGEFDRLRFVESDPRRAALAEEAGFEVVSADCATAEGLEQAGIHPNAVVVVASADDEFNFRVAEFARERFGVENVIALAHTVEQADALRRLGARPVTPALATHVVTMSLIHDPNFFGMVQSDEVKVHEVVLRDGALAGTRVKDLPLPQGVLILSIHRDREHIIPRGSTEVNVGDRLTLIGQPEVLREAEERLRR